jgi:hypothetical protein
MRRDLLHRFQEVLGAPHTRRRNPLGWRSVHSLEKSSAQSSRAHRRLASKKAPELSQPNKRSLPKLLLKESDRKNSNMGCSSRLAGTWSLPVVLDAVMRTHGLQQATGRLNESFIFTLEELTRSKITI